MNAKQFMQRVARLPCQICEMQGIDGSPSEVHHVFDADRRSDWLVVPLCAEHHRGASGVHGLHRRGFEARYKVSDEDLISMTISKVLRGVK